MVDLLDRDRSRRRTRERAGALPRVRGIELWRSSIALAAAHERGPVRCEPARHGFGLAFGKRYAEAGAAISEDIKRYAADVRRGAFPAPENSFPIDDALLWGL